MFMQDYVKVFSALMMMLEVLENAIEEVMR